MDRRQTILRSSVIQLSQLRASILNITRSAGNRSKSFVWSTDLIAEWDQTNIGVILKIYSVRSIGERHLLDKRCFGGLKPAMCNAAWWDVNETWTEARDRDTRPVESETWTNPKVILLSSSSSSYAFIINAIIIIPLKDLLFGIACTLAYAREQPMRQRVVQIRTMVKYETAAGPTMTLSTVCSKSRCCGSCKIAGTA